MHSGVRHESSHHRRYYVEPDRTSDYTHYDYDPVYTKCLSLIEQATRYKDYKKPNETVFASVAEFINSRRSGVRFAVKIIEERMEEPLVNLKINKKDPRTQWLSVMLLDFLTQSCEGFLQGCAKKSFIKTMCQMAKKRIKEKNRPSLEVNLSPLNEFPSSSNLLKVMVEEKILQLLITWSEVKDGPELYKTTVNKMKAKGVVFPPPGKYSPPPPKSQKNNSQNKQRQSPPPDMAAQMSSMREHTELVKDIILANQGEENLKENEMLTEMLQTNKGNRNKLASWIGWLGGHASTPAQEDLLASAISILDELDETNNLFLLKAEGIQPPPGSRAHFSDSQGGGTSGDFQPSQDFAFFAASSSHGNHADHDDDGLLAGFEPDRPQHEEVFDDGLFSGEGDDDGNREPDPWSLPQSLSSSSAKPDYNPFLEDDDDDGDGGGAPNEYNPFA